MVCLVVDSDRDTERVARYLGGGFVDGAIIVSARENDPITRVVERLALPAVYVGHPPGLVRRCRTSGIDNRGAARADHRAPHGHRPSSRRHDRRRPRPGLGRRPARRIHRCARRPVRRAHRGADPVLLDTRRGRAAMRALLEREPGDRRRVRRIRRGRGRRDGGTASTAGGACRATSGVVGFDDSAWATRTQPALSTVRQPAAELGSRAAALVLDRLRGDSTRAASSLTPRSSGATRPDAVSRMRCPTGGDRRPAAHRIAPGSGRRPGSASGNPTRIPPRAPVDRDDAQHRELSLQRPRRGRRVPGPPADYPRLICRPGIDQSAPFSPGPSPAMFSVRMRVRSFR